MAVVNESLIQEFKELYDKLKSTFQEEKLTEEKNPNAGDTSDKTDMLAPNFESLLKRIDEVINKTEKENPDYIKLLAMQSSLKYEQAKLKLIHDNTAECQEMLQEILDSIVSLNENDIITFLYLRIVNHLSYILSKNGHLEKARTLLESVTEKEYNTSTLVYSTEDLFADKKPSPETSTSKFNKLMINNMQMLGWIYGRLGLHDLHIQTEHRALQRQLDVGDMLPIAWAAKCCRLATLFLTKFKWSNARYHLSALASLLEKMKNETNPEAELAQAQADLARAWIHYGLHLFSASKKRMLEQLYDNDGNPPPDEELVVPPEEEVSEDLKFNGVDVDIPNVPATYIVDTQEARVLFIHTQTWLKKVRLFYTLRDYPLQYVNAVLDLSELYRFLAFYESDLDSQYNVQKRRSEALEALSTLLREVRPNCYIAVSVELWRELAEVQIELMGINLKRLYSFENDSENEDGIKRRMTAVSDIHSKLETVGDMIGPQVDNNKDTFEEEDKVECSSK